jgi:hypothetical protein
VEDVAASLQLDDGGGRYVAESRSNGGGGVVCGFADGARGVGGEVVGGWEVGDVGVGACGGHGDCWGELSRRGVYVMERVWEEKREMEWKRLFYVEQLVGVRG